MATRRRVPAHRTYTPALLANGQHRFETSDESIASIAADFAIQPFSFRRLAKRLGWVRPERPQRDLPTAARLLAQAQALEAGAAAALPHPEGGRPDGAAVREGGDAVAPAQGMTPARPAQVANLPLSGEGGAVETPDAPSASSVIDAAAIERLRQAVLEELASVEAMRAELKALPRRPLDAERTARTLSSLTDTLQKLQRLRCGLPASGSHDDDLPEDMDAFRFALARRIKAFVVSRTAAQAADGAGDGDGGKAANDSLTLTVR